MISLRPSASGSSTTILRSNRPGRSSAASRVSAMLVAPIVSTGGISTRFLRRPSQRNSLPIWPVSCGGGSIWSSNSFSRPLPPPMPAPMPIIT